MKKSFLKAEIPKDKSTVKITLNSGLNTKVYDLYCAVPPACYWFDPYGLPIKTPFYDRMSLYLFFCIPALTGTFCFSITF